MPGCTFNVSANNFDVDAFLSKTGWKSDFTHREGEEMDIRKGHFHDQSGFFMTVSTADGLLSKEIDDVEKFIKENSRHLSSIADLCSNLEMHFDFGYYCRLGEDKDGNIWFSQGEFIEPSFLKLCGELNIGIALSLYEKSDDEEE